MTAPVPTPPAGPAPAPAAPPAPSVPAPAPAPQPEPGQTFTQADVDRIVAERAIREVRTKYADYDDVKAKAAKYDAIEAENATELEKAVNQAVESTRADAAKAMNNTLVRAEVKALAAAAQFHDPADAAALLAEKFSQVPVDASGEVDVTAAKALVDQLATDKPHLVKGATNTGPSPLPGQGTPPAAPATSSVAAGRQLYEQQKNKQP